MTLLKVLIILKLYRWLYSREESFFIPILLKVLTKDEMKKGGRLLWNQKERLRSQSPS
jgi:hypothetical protein